MKKFAFILLFIAIKYGECQMLVPVDRTVSSVRLGYGFDPENPLKEFPSPFEILKTRKTDLGWEEGFSFYLSSSHYDFLRQTNFNVDMNASFLWFKAGYNHEEKVSHRSSATSVTISFNYFQEGEEIIVDLDNSKLREDIQSPTSNYGKGYISSLRQGIIVYGSISIQTNSVEQANQVKTFFNAGVNGLFNFNLAVAEQFNQKFSSENLTISVKINKFGGLLGDVLVINSTTLNFQELKSFVERQATGSKVAIGAKYQPLTGQVVRVSDQIAKELYNYNYELDAIVNKIDNVFLSYGNYITDSQENKLLAAKVRARGEQEIIQNHFKGGQLPEFNKIRLSTLFPITSKVYFKTIDQTGNESELLASTRMTRDLRESYLCLRGNNIENRDKVIVRSEGSLLTKVKVYLGGQGPGSLIQEWFISPFDIENGTGKFLTSFDIHPMTFSNYRDRVDLEYNNLLASCSNPNFGRTYPFSAYGIVEDVFGQVALFGLIQHNFKCQSSGFTVNPAFNLTPSSN